MSPYSYNYIDCIVNASVGRFQEKCDNIKSDSSPPPPQGVVVIWEWQVDDDVTHVSETEGITHILESFSHTSDTTNLSDEVKRSSDAECYTEKLFTVTFKCIGCQHDRCAQEALKYVSESMDKGEVIPVNIFPEENNLYDARAIAFKC